MLSDQAAHDLTQALRAHTQITEQDIESRRAHARALDEHTQALSRHDAELAKDRESRDQHTQALRAFVDIATPHTAALHTMAGAVPQMLRASDQMMDAAGTMARAAFR